METYTGFESTSVTYEKAEQLMEAVLYCIRELETSDRPFDILAEKLPAQQAYEIGREYVTKQVKSALNLYQEMIQDLHCYGNRCLYDTVVKGIPEFFKWYDIESDPQNAILTLDYPILRDLSKDCGVDKIYKYLSCIQMEKIFLEKFPEDQVIRILRKYNDQYEDNIENLCEIVFTSFIAHLLVQKPFSQAEFTDEELSRLQKRLLCSEQADLKLQMVDMTAALVQNYYESNPDLLKYLTGALDDILVRLRAAARSGSLVQIL